MLQRKILYKSIKVSMDLLNIKYINEQCEADLINSKLCSEGFVDGNFRVDHLTSGARYLMRDFNVNNNNVKCYGLGKSVINGINS